MLRKVNFKEDFNDFKTNLKILKRIFSYMLGYKIILFTILITAFFSSSAWIIGTSLLKIIIDKYIEPLTKNYSPELMNGFIHILLIATVIYLIDIISAFLSKRLTVTMVANSLYKIKIDLFNKMEDLSIEYFDSNKHGELMSLYTNDINALREMLNQIFSGCIFSVVSIIGSIYMMLYYNLQLTLITIFSVSISCFFARKVSKKGSIYFKEQQDKLAKLNGFVEEMIEGQKVVKVFCHEEILKNDFKKINNEVYEASVKAGICTSFLFSGLVNILNTNYVITSVIGGVFVLKSIISVGTLLPFILYARGMIDPVIDIIDQLPSILSAIAGAKRIFDVIDKEPEIDEGKIKIEGEVEGRVEFKNVVFNYKNGENTLNSINLKASKGEKVVLVGSTGAGKTTIMSILNRFYDVNSGEITFDGININDIEKSSLRKMFSMVLQDTYLFTGTIMENIRYGRLEATDEEVLNAASLANADKFILNLPNGYNTVLTADATNLSQGERQLLAIARAIISNRPVLILDEATSSIDTRTEKFIEEAINNLIKDKTVFLIAHRLSTVRNADKIVVLEHGEIIEQGNHEELLKNKGRYYELCNGLSELE